MRKRVFVTFGIFVAVFGVLIPYLAISNDGASDKSVAQVPESFGRGQSLFQSNCGSCHTLAKAGTDGIVGPNLDELLGTSAPDARQSRVEGAIRNGGTGVGKMPSGIVTGADVKTVTAFVARAAKTQAAP